MSIERSPFKSDGQKMVEEALSVQEKKKLSYAEAIERYEQLKDAVDETERLDFRERPAEGQEEQLLAILELEQEACLNEAEAYAQKNDPNGERAMRILAEFKEAEATLLSLYFDAKAVSPEFSSILETEHPWLRSTMEKSFQKRKEQDTEEDLNQYEKAA